LKDQTRCRCRVKHFTRPPRRSVPIGFNSNGYLRTYLRTAKFMLRNHVNSQPVPPLLMACALYLRIPSNTYTSDNDYWIHHHPDWTARLLLEIWCSFVWRISRTLGCDPVRLWLAILSFTFQLYGQAL
jgi:hypothetical protein